MKTVLRPVIIGGFGPPALACLRSWGESGFCVGMVCIRSKQEPLPASKYLSEYATLPRHLLHTANGLIIINDFIKRFNADGIICISEDISCWINENRHRLHKKTAIWLSPSKIIKKVLSKNIQTKIAQNVGLDVLPTYLLDKNASIDAVLSNHFPLCLRPSEPKNIAPSFKVHVVFSRRELAKYLQSFEKISNPIIAQPFLNLPNLVVHGVRTHLGASLNMKAFLVENKFEGVTLTIKHIALDNDLRNKCIAFTDALRIVGNYHFEFLFDVQAEKTFFIEINSRFGGTTAKVFACGYNEPLSALCAYGIKTKNWNKLHSVTASNKQALLKYFFYAISGRLTSLDYPDESTLLKVSKTLRNFVLCKDDVFNFDDIKGSIALYAGNLKSKFTVSKNV